MPDSTRIRQQGSLGPVNVTINAAFNKSTSGHFACTNYGPGTRTFGTRNIGEYHSQITDAIGTFGTGGYTQKSCTHEWRRVNVMFPTYHSCFGQCDSTFTFTGRPGVRDVEVNLFTGVRPPDSEFRLWCDQAFASLTQQFPTEVSIANFIWELRELKDLIPKIQDGLSKVAANGYLTLEFGWLPLISDLQKLWNIQKVVKTRLDYLLARWGKPTRVGTAKVINTPPRVERQYGLFEEAGLFCRVDLVSSVTTYRAGGFLLHTLEWLRQADSEWHAMMGSLGFLDPLSVVWNAIPYSFAADWFLNVGSWVDRYGHIVEEAEHWNVYKLTSSQKTVATWNIVQVNPIQGFRSKSSPDRLIMTLNYSRYVRYVGLPVSSFFDPSSLLSPKQLALLAALAVGHS